MQTFDVVVIGAGPGGYVAAIKAAQLGLSVACIEKEKTLGGTCLNVGCIPSKALLSSSEHYFKLLHEGKEHGIEFDALTLNFAAMQKRKEGIVSTLVGGIDFLFKKNKVTRFLGEATVLSSNTVAIKGSSGVEEIQAKNIVLATGSVPTKLPFLPFDEEKILSSTGALALKKVPKKLLMVGAGVIGLELGSVYQRLGAQVEVVELLDRACPSLDHEISKQIQKVFEKEGMRFHLSCRVSKGEKTAKGVKLFFTTAQGEEKSLEADVVLVAIGRSAYCEGLGLEKLGIAQDKLKRVIVDDQFRTSIPTIYAIGDLIDGPMLAHKASEEAIAVSHILAGFPQKINYMAVPNVMYTWPEAASVGLTEEEALAQGLEIKVGKCPFKANSRARCTGDTDGLVKIIGHKPTKRLIGMHILGPNASEMIGEGVLAIENKMTVDELAAASHAHPTCSEAIKEAALATFGRAIHF